MFLPCRAIAEEHGARFAGGVLWSGAEIKCDVRRGIAPGGDGCDSGFGGRGGPSPITQARFIGREQPKRFALKVCDPKGCFG